MSEKKKTYHIGVMVGNFHSPYSKSLLSGVYEAARDEDVKITLFLGSYGSVFDFWRHYDFYSEYNSESYDYQFDALFSYSLISSLDALVISYGTVCTYFDKRDKEVFLSRFRDVPLIILEEYDEQSDDSFLMNDNYAGMCEIMEHLIRDHGYKKIVHISGPKTNMDATNRRQAYLDKMKEAGLSVTEEMIEYGDFSPEVDHLVERILDNNPDLEAIACANDGMAVSTYRVLANRGLKAGRDIAVTGFDDMDLARRMDPPLTTVRQDTFDMGFRSIKMALSVCENGVSQKQLIPARMVKRSSCGCAQTGRVARLTAESLDRIRDHEDLPAIRAAAEAAARDSIKDNNRTAALEACVFYYEHLILLLCRIREGSLSEEDLPDIRRGALAAIKGLLNEQNIDAIELSRFTDIFHQVLHYLQKGMEEKDAILLTGSVLETADAYLQATLLSEGERSREILQHRTWMAPVMIQKMMENVADEERFYAIVTDHLRASGAKSAFVYLLEEPVHRTRGTEFECPETLYLAGEYKDGKLTAYPPKMRPPVNRQDGLVSRYPQETAEGHCFVAFALFAEEYQYGLMVCEIEEKNVQPLYGVGLQISSAMAYLRISKQEAEAKANLFQAMQTLSEKNQILSFMSSIDALTKLYNRRGFMEYAIDFVNQNVGKKAAVFFSDLDHLKQINDIYGHAEGDFAITESANVLREVFRKPAETGRMGGDEFISIALMEDTTPEAVVKDIKSRLSLLNDVCGKPYYVDLSVGFEPFVCEKNIRVGELTELADMALYEAKKLRRPSVIKQGLTQ